jgi:competence protein CoiA
VEFQNSPMSLAEMYSRENFYGQMLWIVNGARFENNFHILAKLPDPKVDWVSDFVFSPMSHTYRDAAKRLVCWRKSENPNYKPGDLVLVYNDRSLYEMVEKNYIGHHLFDWVKPRTVWYSATKRVFFDFDTTYLWELKFYSEQDFLCIQAIQKQDLIAKILDNSIN